MKINISITGLCRVGSLHEGDCFICLNEVCMKIYNSTGSGNCKWVRLKDGMTCSGSPEDMFEPIALVVKKEAK